MQPPIHLRSLDGIHLAAALQAQCHTLITTDQRMKAAAAMLGLVLAFTILWVYKGLTDTLQRHDVPSPPPHAPD